MEEQEYILNSLELITCSRRGKIYLNENGVSFIKKCKCPHTLSIVLYMATFKMGWIFTKDELFKHFYTNTMGNLAFLDYILDNMVNNQLLFTNK